MCIVSHHLVLGGCAPICNPVCVQLGPLTSEQQCLGWTSGCEETPGKKMWRSHDRKIGECIIRLSVREKSLRDRSSGSSTSK